MTAPVVFVTERRREAFLRFTAGRVAGKWLAGDDRGEHAALGSGPLETFDFGVGPARCGSSWRAEHDQELRGGERCLDLFTKVGAGGKILLIAEDGRQAPGNDAVRGQLPGQ